MIKINREAARDVSSLFGKRAARWIQGAIELAEKENQKEAEMIKVKNEIPVYEVNGKDHSPVERDVLLSVSSHWNCSDRIVVKLGETELTVIGRDLMNAIENALNTR